MRVEHDGISGGADVDDVAAERGNRVRAGRDRTDDTKGRIFFERDTVIAAARVGAEPVHTGHQLNQAQLGDLVIEAADLGFFKFNFAPLLGILLGHRLDDFLNLAAGSNAFFLQLQKRFLRGFASFFRRCEHAELAAQRGRGGGFLGAAAAGFRLPRGG